MWSILLGTLAGVALGTISGIVPGIHANTMAGILLALDAALIPILGVEPLAAAMFAALIAHSFLDIIPSTFLGVPDADTAIAVLPAHTLCLAGEGIQAVRLSALGSAFGVAIAVPLSLIFYLVLPLAQPFLDWSIGILLIAVAGYLIVVSEAPGWSFGVFAVSGILGVFTFQNAHLSWNSIGDMAILMPLLSGLFGLSVLLFSSNSPVPEQHHTPIPLSDRELGRFSLMGTVAGALVGWLPGLSNATANALLAPVVGYESHGRSYIVATSAANTANAILGLSALYAITRTRNGVMVAIAAHDLPPFWLLLFCGVLAASIAYLLTLRLSRHAVWLNGLNARRLNHGVIGLIAILSLALCGPFGILILILATAIGVAPALANVQRVFCMGAVMLPIILQSLGFGFL